MTSNDGDRTPLSHIALPCGAIGHLDNMGYRCEDCMAIWGSIGCGCSNDLAKQKREGDAAKVKPSQS